LKGQGKLKRYIIFEGCGMLMLSAKNYQTSSVLVKTAAFQSRLIF